MLREAVAAAAASVESERKKEKKKDKGKKHDMIKVVSASLHPREKSLHMYRTVLCELRDCDSSCVQRRDAADG